MNKKFQSLFFWPRHRIKILKQFQLSMSNDQFYSILMGAVDNRYSFNFTPALTVIILHCESHLLLIDGPVNTQMYKLTKIEHYFLVHYFILHFHSRSPRTLHPSHLSIIFTGNYWANYKYFFYSLHNLLLACKLPDFILSKCDSHKIILRFSLIHSRPVVSLAHIAFFMF